MHQRSAKSFRIASYNIHKCRGMDRRVRPERIGDVLDELDADIVALQEVVGPGTGGGVNQARQVAEGRGYHAVFGRNRAHNGADYGNLVLSRYPVSGFWNYNITTREREPRGVLRADVKLADGRLLHLFNVHLGTAYHERREQAIRLLSRRILRNQELPGARILVGDFNEWFSGFATRLLAAHFASGPHANARSCRTYPGILPFLRLDHIYFDRGLTLQRMERHRSRLALMASDHLPIVAEFALDARQEPFHRTRSRFHRATRIPALENGRISPAAH